MRPLLLEIRRVLNADRARVFAAFSTSDLLASWWGPEGFTTRDLDYRPRVGDRYRIDMQPPDGEPFALLGEFREVDPPARLAFTFVWEDPDPEDVETLVELAFHDLGDATEVHLRQGAFRTEPRLALHRDGWTESFDKLERALTDR